MSGHDLKSFIETVLIKQLKCMAYTGDTQYLAFGNIAMGIEFLGACTDTHGFNVSGFSKRRFEAGIETYMKQVDTRYSAYNQPTSPHFLYKNLRCGMAHIIRPQGSIGLIGKAGAQGAGYAHLDQTPSGTLIMTAEDFYEDFAQACDLLIADLPSKTDAKFAGTYLPVSNLPSNPASGSALPSNLDTTNTGLSGQP